MGENEKVRKGLSLPVALARDIDDFRFASRYKSDAEALRVLIEAGLKSLKARADTHANA